MTTYLRIYLVCMSLFLYAFSAYSMDVHQFLALKKNNSSDLKLSVLIQSDDSDTEKDCLVQSDLKTNRAKKRPKSELKLEKENFFGGLFAWLNFNFSSSQEIKEKNTKKTINPPKVVKYTEKVTESSQKKYFSSKIYRLMNNNKLVSLTSQQMHGNNENSIIQCKVAQQSGATCAYHALKNGLYMAMLPFVAENNTQLRSNILFALQSKEEVKRLIGSQGHWRSKVQQYIKNERRELGNDGEWLDKEAIESALMDFEKSNKNILFASKITEDNITIIDNVENRSTIVYDEVFLKLCHKMRDPEASFVHIFLVGNMQQTSGNSGLGFGHWYTLVVNKVKDKTQFFVSDSLGHSRLDDKKIKKIREYLETGDCSAMVQRLYLNDTVERLLACIRAYVADEYNIKEDYSRQKRAERIVECKESLDNLLQKYSQDLSEGYIKEVQQCMRIGEHIISLDNTTLLNDLPRYIPDLMKVRATMNKDLYLQTKESDDFEVPFTLWRIAYYISSQEESLQKQVPALIKSIKPKINQAGTMRKKYGEQFLELINKRPSSQEQLEEYRKKLLTIAGYYVNV